MILSTRKTLLFKALLFVLPAIMALFLPTSAFASISTGNSSNLDQLNFRWRFDDGSQSAATWRAATNTGITDISLTETSLRIRVNIDVPTARTNVSVQPRLEFSSDATTCTDGTWTIIGTQGSASVFRLKASANFVDGDPTTQQISADTFVVGDIYESTQTGSAITIAGSSESTEVEWSIEANSPAESTTYRFRATNAGTAFGAYTNCATLVTETPAVTTFTFNSYRWYVDPTSPESEDVTDPWGNPDINQDTAISPLPVSNDPPNTTQELRLRVNFTVNGDGLAVGEKAFKLQFKADAAACTDATGWTDVGAAQAWEFATSGVTDGTDLSVSRLSPVSNVLEEYIKSNPTGTNPFSANIGDEIEYDFHIVGTNSATATRYRFRVIESGGTVFDAYTNCPTLTTEPGVGNLLRHGNFFSGGSEQGFFWAN